MNENLPSVDPLVAILCGFEKSGTTVLNEILRRHPQLDSGHEVGVLMASTPREFKRFQPYYSFFRQSWKLTPEETQHCCNTDDWGTFYQRARQASPVIIDKSTLIFDKTPRYMMQLSEVMDKVPHLPCIVNVRDPRALMHSWACWSGFKDSPAEWLEDNFQSNCERFLNYAKGYSVARASERYRLYLNRFEIMCLEPRATMTSIFDFLGYEFSDEYMFFESEHFVYSNTLTDNHVIPYREDFSDALCKRILDATAEYADWHYHD